MTTTTNTGPFSNTLLNSYRTNIARFMRASLLLLGFYFGLLIVPVAQSQSIDEEQANKQQLLIKQLHNADTPKQIKLLGELIELTKRNQPKLALDYARQLEPLLESTPSSEANAKLMVEIIYINSTLDDFKVAESYISKLQRWATKNQMPRYQTLAYIRQAVVFRSQSKLEQAQLSIQKALFLADKFKFHDLKTDTHYELAIISFYLGATKTAISNIRIALEQFKQAGKTRNTGKALNILAILYGTQGRYQESLDIMLQALNIAESINDNNSLVSLYSNIALTMSRLNQQEESEPIYQKSLALARKMGDKSSEALALVNLGSVYSDLKRFPRAIDTLRNGLAIANEINSPNISARALSILSRVSMLTENHEESYRYATQALTLIKDTNDNDIGMSPRRNLAQYYLYKGEYSEALEQINLFLQWANDKGDRVGTGEGLELKSEIYESMGNFKQALQLFKQYRTIVDETFNEKSDARITALRAGFDAKQKDLEIESLEQHKTLQGEKLKRQQALLTKRQLQQTIIIIALLSVFLVSFLIYKRLNQRKLTFRLSKEVKERTQDLNRKNEELKIAYQLVEEKSFTDDLTGLNNRRFLMKHIEEDVQKLNFTYQHSVSESDLPDEANLLFFLVDLDHFKKVNDTYGHAAGDMVLMQISDVLSSVFRQTDYIIRWGGEEFLIVVKGANRNEASNYAERLREIIESHTFNIGDDNSVKKTCSIGFTFYPCFKNQPEKVSWTQVIDIADQCLYAAKRSHRNAWVGLDFYNSDPEQAIFPDFLYQPFDVIEQLNPSVMSSVANEKLLQWPAA